MDQQQFKWDSTYNFQKDSSFYFIHPLSVAASSWAQGLGVSWSLSQVSQGEGRVTPEPLAPKYTPTDGSLSFKENVKTQHENGLITFS